MYGKLKRAVHIDFHTLPGIYDFNKGFDASAFAERLKKSHVNYVNVFAECNLGFAYYDTKIGVKYPTMKEDMFGDILRECHKRDIGVTAYFNFGIDNEACRLHRDWMKLSKSGAVLWNDFIGPGSRLPCPATGYGDYQYEMIRELIEKYPEVDGIFLDCVNFVPCYGNECLEAVKARGGDPTNDEDVKKYAFDVTMQLLEKIKKLIGDRNLICNSQPYWLMKKLNSHIEVECLPGAGGWNYDHFTVNVAYARNIKQKVIYMSGRFQVNWGDLGGLKTYASMENDMFDAQMNAVECSFGDHMHPAGNLDEKVYDNIEKIYSRIMTYEPWTDGARFRADVGVLCDINSGTFGPGPYHGLARMLSELKMPFDVVNETMDFSKYKLLVIPDTVRLSKELAEKVKEHIRLGKPVISTGVGGLDKNKDEFALCEYDFKVDEIDTSSQAFYKYPNDDFRYATYVQGIKMSAGKSAKIIAEYHKAYFNRVWDGFHGFYYLPPEKWTGQAMALVSGKVCHIAFNLFTAYNQKAYVEHKKLFKKCLEEIGFVPTISTDLPSTARVTLTETSENLLLHIKTTFAEARGGAPTIEERIKYPAGAKISILGRFKNATIVPCNEKVDAVISDDKIEIVLPEIDGYLCIALKK